MLGVYADLPWSYAAGAGIALAAAHQLRGARHTVPSPPAVTSGAPSARTAEPPASAAPSTRPTATTGSSTPSTRPAGIIGSSAPSARPAVLTGSSATFARSAVEGPPVGRAPRVTGAAGGRHFALAMAYSVLIFVPASLFVAHRYPQWATAQHEDALSREALAWLGAAEVALTAAGFLVARALLVAGRIRWAVCQVILGCLLLCLAVVHGRDGDGWKRFLSSDRDDYARFPRFLHVADIGPIAGHVAGFLTSGLAVVLYTTGAVVLGTLGVVMGLLHQFGLTDAGADGPGPLRAALVAAVVGGGALVLAVLVSALVSGVGWVALAAVLPVLWLAVAARGAFATVVITDLGLPAEHDPAV
ncbi:hypothetical protein [Actinomadura fibrosa]|uniref:Uncharacterized protein n=1 Tax=Actinomadura fibrosa TaxID=111802 RepID=A0ABW2XY03_9ACTN